MLLTLLKMNTLKTHFTLVINVIILLSLSIIFFACNKKNDPAPGKTQLSIVQAVSDTYIYEFDFKIDGQKFNKAPLAYESLLPYAEINAGKQEFSVTLKNDHAVLFKSAVDLRKDRFYTVFISSVAGYPVKPLFLITQEDPTATDNNFAKIRFINLSRDAGAVNLSISNGSSPLFTKLQFREATVFKTVTPGQELSFEVKEDAQPAILATLEKVKIEKGKIYTLYVKGLKNGTTANTKLSLSMISNN